MAQSNSWLVLKFGGTSVSSRENWEKIIQVVKERQQQGTSICIVHSAFKDVSNLLEHLIQITDADKAATVISKIKKQHLEMAQALGLDGSALLEDYFQELENISNGIVLIGEVGPRVQARMLALGELMATRLGSAFLNKQGINTTWTDARDHLQSVPQKNVSREQSILGAVCNDEEEAILQENFLAADSIILTQGFIARDREGKTVLLGRGGSDVSAAYFAAKLAADRLEIWTDVPGLFSANPSQVSSARLLKKLSYEEAQEIATNGASVLHPRCIYPARRHGIPIHVRCTQRPDLQGTIITNFASDEEGVLKTVALRKQITLVSMESLGMWQQVGFLSDAFSVFKQFGLSIDLISTSESNVTVSLDPSLNLHFEDIRSEFIEALSSYCKVEIIDSVAAISLLGHHIQTILHRLGDMFQVFQDHEIYMVSQASNNLNFTFVVDSNQADRLVRQLHEQIISQSGNRPSLGGTWSELMETDREEQEQVIPWWQAAQQQLLDIAGNMGSAYVYSKNEIGQNVHRLRQLKAVDRYFYAMKANSNDEVLQQFFDAGLGFECVSIGEVQRVLDLFPDIDRDRILFTPNFAPRSEYERAFEYGIHVTLDNIYPLRQWPETFDGEEFFLRIDPGHGQGHHKHVQTGGNHSKFGIPRVELAEAAERIEKIGGRVKGLHAHAGSGIKDEQRWKDTALILHEAARHFDDIEILDLGGGLGIPEHETDSSLNMKKVDQHLQDFKAAYPNYELWIEPGRFLTASAGVLLTTVTQLKGKGSVRYVGVETGMNSLIRPALYGASHSIANLSKLDQPCSQHVNIVGPICESADKLGVNRRFPDSEEGDIILIANAGAYGHVMSSYYNLRPPAEEVFLDA